MDVNLENELDEAKATGEESYSADAVTPEGGNPKKRRADAFRKAEDPQAGTPVATPQGTNNAGLHEMITSLFDGQGLSEEFKEKTVTIFEAAVHEKVVEIKESLEAEFEKSLAEEVQTVVEDLTNKLDSYLDYVIENWMKENEVALEVGYKVQVAESILNSVKAIVEDHKIEINEEEVEAIASIEEAYASLEEKYNEVVETLIAERSEREELQKNLVISEMTEGMVATDAARFKTLAEGLSYDSIKEFTEKAVTIKESYFSNNVTRAEDHAEYLEEEVEEPVSPKVDPSVAAYVASLNKFAKN